MTAEAESADRMVGGGTVTAWTPAQVRGIDTGMADAAPVIGEDQVVPVADDLAIWDAWPVQDATGDVALLPGGETLWMALGTPPFADPEERHGHARIHLIAQDRNGWRHLGPAMPDGFSPGSREWSGSALLAADGTTLTLFFTATGRRGETAPTFEQRLFQARATLSAGPDGHRLTDWRELCEMIVRDPAHYMASDAGTGRVGTIKAFRDPAWFRDPRDGRHHIFFAGSLADTHSAFNGCIGWAVARDAALDDWALQPPLIAAEGVNNELERPHVVLHDGLYYLFWSTQRHVFDPDGPVGPTGLYGMVSDRLDGGWRPLNGTGLVFANPAAAPKQAYSWLVLPDLRVTSFIDAWGSDGADANANRFGATFAPMLHLTLQGDRAGLSGAP